MKPRVGISIVFNGAHHLIGTSTYSQMNRLPHFLDKWIIVEGASSSTFCTSWCKAMPDEYHKNGASTDNTLDILERAQKVACNAEIVIIPANGLWNGKVEMFNRALQEVKHDCYLWQVDIDEYWTKQKMEHAETILTNLKASTASFHCDYLITPDIIVRGTWGEATKTGYIRLWDYKVGNKFLSHEPPVIQNHNTCVPPHIMPRFTHLSYFYEKDVLFKSKWYTDHENIHTGWKEIVSGKVQLPARIDALFKKPVQEAWKDTIITYV